MSFRKCVQTEDDTGDDRLLLHLQTFLHRRGHLSGQGRIKGLPSGALREGQEEEPLLTINLPK